MSADQEKHDGGRLQHDAEHERPHRRNSVLFYLVILFAAAFLLLLLSYFSQQRANEAAMDNLEATSSSAVETLDQILQERDSLKTQVAGLEEQLAQAQQELAGLKTLTDNLTVYQEQLTRAMDLFWQIDEAYVRGRYALCRELIAQMEDVSAGSALKEYLPAESTTDNDRFSPAQRYQEICDILN